MVKSVCPGHRRLGGGGLRDDDGGAICFKDGPEPRLLSHDIHISVMFGSLPKRPAFEYFEHMAIFSRWCHAIEPSQSLPGRFRSLPSTAGPAPSFRVCSIQRTVLDRVPDGLAIASTTRQ